MYPKRRHTLSQSWKNRLPEVIPMTRDEHDAYNETPGADGDYDDDEETED